MTRKFTDLQLLRNLVEPVSWNSVSPAEQAVINVVSLLWLFDTVPATRDDLIDAIASAYVNEYDFGGNE